MDMFIIMATFIGILVQTSHSVTTKTEQGSSNQTHCSIENQHLPHETKCNLYYRCVYGRKVLKCCPTEKLFNIKIGNCDENYNVNCGFLEVDHQEENRYLDNSLDEHAIEVMSIDYTNWEKEGFDHLSDNAINTLVTYANDDFTISPNECPENTDPYEDAQLLPHEKKCNSFYKCFQGKKYTMSCPGILQFNPRILVCDWPTNVKCIEKVYSTSSTTEEQSSTVCPKIECQESTIYLPHPLNIRRYIRCENGKEVTEECPNGLVFDTNIHTCNFPALP